MEIYTFYKKYGTIYAINKKEKKVEKKSIIRNEWRSR